MNILCAANFSFVCVYNSESVLLYKTLDMVYHPDRSHTKHHVFCVNPNDTQLNFENSFISSGDCYTFLSFFAPLLHVKTQPLFCIYRECITPWHQHEMQLPIFDTLKKWNLNDKTKPSKHFRHSLPPPQQRHLTSNRTYRMHLARTKFFFQIDGTEF